LNKRLFALLACLVPFALITAGCGSSDNTESTATTAALTKAQFLKQGNAICAEGNKEINKKFKAFFTKENLNEHEEPSKAQKEEAAETILIPAIKKDVEGIKALGAPEGEEEQVEEILDAAEEAIEELESEPAEAIEESNHAFVKVNKLSREYGLTVCGEEEEGKEAEEGKES
jgi:hypothetical protein